MKYTKTTVLSAILTLITSSPFAEPASNDANLPVRYAVPPLAAFNDASKIEEICDDELETLRAHFSALEGYPGTPTFGGFYRSFDSLLASTGNLTDLANLIDGVHPDELTKQVADACAQELARLSSAIMVSRPIYDRLQAMDLSGANAQSRYSVEKLLQVFRLAGVGQDEENRAQVTALTETIGKLRQDFGKQLRNADDERFLTLDSAERLAGLPQDFVDARLSGADGTVRVSSGLFTDVLPIMEYAADDQLRKDAMILALNVGYPETVPVLRRLLAARHELAVLLGFENFAEYVLSDKMARSPEQVAVFLQHIQEATAESRSKEYDLMLSALRTEDAEADRVEAWQAIYLVSKIKRDSYDVDSRIVRQFFPYQNVKRGVFALIEDLFNVEIVPWTAPTWHKDVETFSILDGEKLIGHFYLDMHPRENKGPGAAQWDIVRGVDGRQVPVAALICAFPSGQDLMQPLDVSTFLHEFGHLLHELFAGSGDWYSISGGSVEFDFVEAPSTMLEEWFWDYETLASFAVGSAGEPLPRELFDRMLKARYFGQATLQGIWMYMAALSLDLHAKNPDEIDLAELDTALQQKYTPFEPLAETHYYASFGHLISYSAMFYTYLWSDAVAADMFTRFEAAGLRDRKVADDYRRKVLVPGGSRPADQLVQDFLGRPISFNPYTESLGR